MRFIIIACPPIQGRSQFRVCRFAVGTQKTAFTEQCLNQRVLRQASSVGGQAGWKWWYHKSANDVTTTLQLPGDLVCGGSAYKCVLQYRYQTGRVVGGSVVGGIPGVHVGCR